jgi:glycosyltransferase involved in cell wall biosynthesis
MFWDSTSHPAQIALALYIFIYMFNWVRGGTIIVQSVILFSIPVALMLGVRPVLRAIFTLAGEAVGLVGVAWGSTSRIFFYPHAYLRDRQLDTIRTWPIDQGVNANIAVDRHGSQVSREQALAQVRPSWKTRLPLLNIKRRPENAPTDSAVYVWGGLIARGPFITDIDNPYAFTAYNAFAVKIYRPVIRWFLESQHCLQIRCLSRACLDGVRREYGEVAAAKSVLAYPVITPAVSKPEPQPQDRCRFLFVSTQFEIKGGEALLKAFGRVVENFPAAELDLVTYLPDHFATLAAQIPNVRIHSASLSRDEIAMNFLAKAHVLVHPTYMESFGMVVLEALSHGLPVIATDVYAIHEMVEDGRNGILLEPPLSIWSGTKPTQLFSDVQKVCNCARTVDMSKFEDALFSAMHKMALDVDFRDRAGAVSLELIRTRFAGTE